jgi:hypothetical protein
MKTTKFGLISVIFSLMLSVCALQAGQATGPVVVVKTAVLVNGMPSVANINSLPSKVTVADVGLDKIDKIGVAMEFEFKVNGVAVDVQNFKATRADMSLVKQGVKIWTDTPFGQYHAYGSGGPYYYVFDSSGVNKTPLGGFVSGMNDNTGTLIPVISKFRLLDLSINHGNSVNPLFSERGEFFTLVQNWTFTYQYLGLTYTKMITPAETEVSVRVIDGISEFVNSVPPTPCVIELQVSDNLVNWVTAPGVFITNPRPTVPLNIIAMVPKTSNVIGLVHGNSKRFYRYKQTKIF